MKKILSWLKANKKKVAGAVAIAAAAVADGANGWGVVKAVVGSLFGG